MRPVGIGPHFLIEAGPASWAALWSAQLESRIPYTEAENVEKASGFTDDSRSRWVGGSASELSEALRGKCDLTRFMIAKERVESSDMMERVRKELETLNPRRRRIWSDNGQWVEDRRFEPEAFEDFKRKPSPARAISLVFEMGENADVSAEKIAEFGATGWAIVDAIEAAGISVTCALNYSTRWSWDGCDSLTQTVRLKDSGEFLAPSFMAGFMTPNFFRRAVFTATTASADAAGKAVSSGLGSAVRFDSPASYSADTGTLRLLSSALGSKGLTDAILAAIRDAA